MAADANAARRRARRGFEMSAGEMDSSLFETSLLSSINMVLEDLLHLHGGGVNCACLGRGELHWYKLCCKEGRQNDAVRELIQTGGLSAVVVPQRKERSVSSTSGRSTWRKVKYEHGSAVLVLARLTMGHINAVESMSSLSHTPAPCWWHHVAYSSIRTKQPLILPRPMTEEELREVTEFEASGPTSRTELTEFAALEKDRLKATGHYVHPC